MRLGSGKWLPGTTEEYELCDAHRAQTSCISHKGRHLIRLEITGTIEFRGQFVQRMELQRPSVQRRIHRGLLIRPSLNLSLKLLTDDLRPGTILDSHTCHTTPSRLVSRTAPRPSEAAAVRL